VAGGGALILSATGKLFITSRSLHFAKNFTWPQVVVGAKIFPHIVNAAIPFARNDQVQMGYNRLKSTVCGWHGSGTSRIVWAPERTSMRD
jgi:hypothetical protein